MRTVSAISNLLTLALALALIITGTPSCAPLRAVVADANRVQCALAPSPPARRHVDGIESACAAGAIVWIVPVDGGVVLVDAGFDETGAQIKAALHGRRVLAILLTHGHLDHRSAAHVFHAPVYVGRDDVALMNGTRGSVAIGARFGDLLGVPPMPKVVIPVDDGFVLDAGKRVFTAVSLPGHTAGSTGWRIDVPSTTKRPTKVPLVTHVMFTGDALQGPEGDAIYPGPPPVTDDMQRAYESVRKLMFLDVDVILDGHFGRLDDVRHRARVAVDRAHDDVTRMEQPADRPAGCHEGDVVP